MNKELLFNTFLQNNSLKSLTSLVSADTDCPVIITDNAFHIVACAGEEKLEDPELRLAVSHSELPLPMCAVIQQGLQREDPVSFNVSKHRCTAKNLSSDGVQLGFMLYFSLQSAQLEDGALGFAEKLIAKQFFAELNSSGSPGDTAFQILTELLDGKYNDKQIFEKRTAGTFLAHFSPERFVLIRRDETALDFESTPRLTEIMQKRFSASHPFLYSGEVIAFIHKDHDIDDLGAFSKDYGLKAVISPVIGCLYDLKKCYTLAGSVMKYLTDKNSGFSIAYADDYTALVRIMAENKDFSITHEGIKRLFLYDKNEKSELCLTLFTYLVCRRSVIDTAGRLFTHRNTVLYRMRKIRDEFLNDMCSPAELTDCFFSLCCALILLGHDELFIFKSDDRRGE